MKVKFLDLTPQYQEIRAQYEKSYKDIMKSNNYISSSFTKSFEEQFAKYIGVNYCVAVNSGTSALHLTLLASRVGQGDEVITSAHSFFASTAAIIHTGATPVLVDIDPKTKNIDPNLIEKAITKRTKAILPVHIYGYTAEMDQIETIARRHKIVVIEDACQAHGSLFKGKMAGSIGKLAAFSFYPGKNLGANGEAGAVTTNDQKLYQKLLMLRDHGAPHKYHHEIVGYNYRLNNIQSAFLSAKLPYLDKWNAGRLRISKRYFQLIAPQLLTNYERFDEHNFHVFSINVPKRDEFMKRLNEKGIATNIHYPIPIHRQKAYIHKFRSKKSFPLTEEQSGSCLSLPMYPYLTLREAEFVAKCVNEVYEELRPKK